MHFARTLDLPAVGTMAHEWFQSWQAVTRLADAQKAALEGWVREYRGRLGIALTDCYSMDSFVRDFLTLILVNFMMACVMIVVVHLFGGRKQLLCIKRWISTL